MRKPGSLSLHCFDSFLRPAGRSWVNRLIPYLYANAPLQTRFVPFAEIEADPDTYAMSQHTYEADWQPHHQAVSWRPWSAVLAESILDGATKPVSDPPLRAPAAAVGVRLSNSYAGSVPPWKTVFRSRSRHAAASRTYWPIACAPSAGERGRSAKRIRQVIVS